MLSLRRILRDHHDAGSVNSLVAIWGFVDDHTFITKAGHLGLVYRVSGVDYECLDQGQRRDVVHRFEASLRLLDESCRVYQYLCKRRIDAIPSPTCSHPVVDDAIRRHVEHSAETALGIEVLGSGRGRPDPRAARSFVEGTGHRVPVGGNTLGV